MARYTDLDLNFTIHPVKKDLVPRTDENAVVYAVRNLILTNHYERPFHPEIGSNIRKMLFEPLSEFTAKSIARLIEETIRNFEPRAQVQRIDVIPAFDQNAYTVRFEFYLISNPKPMTVDFLLERVR